MADSMCVRCKKEPGIKLGLLELGTAYGFLRDIYPNVSNCRFFKNVCGFSKSKNIYFFIHYQLFQNTSVHLCPSCLSRLHEEQEKKKKSVEEVAGPSGVVNEVKK